MLKIKSFALAVIALFATTAPAWALAAKLTAKIHTDPVTHENTVTIYTTSRKPAHCEAWVKFTYLEGAERKDGWTSCGHFITKPGKNVEVCHFTNPALIAPKLNGGVIGGCEEDGYIAPTTAQ